MTHPPIRRFTAFGHSFDMILIEGGAFRRGMEKGDPDYWGVEQPVRRVTVPAFYLGRLPVTQAFWQAVTRETPAYFSGEQRPVEQVSWDAARSFAEKIRQKTD
ncbi:MAG: SUMF1/EgtB/PvdO family nonheme iron enzyme, partial [Saprospiraceae bacterium]|nr:SUMF1/EgtB/PvdO family nonheme iron enzyme [Saprospiraceae bacterium]